MTQAEYINRMPTTHEEDTSEQHQHTCDILGTSFTVSLENFHSLNIRNSENYLVHNECLKNLIIAEAHVIDAIRTDSDPQALTSCCNQPSN